MTGILIGSPLALASALTRRADAEIVGDGGLAVLDQSDFGGGAAHVERDQVGAADRQAQLCGGDNSRRRSGFDAVNRLARRHRRRHHRAAGLHDLQAASDSGRAHFLFEPAQIVGQHRTDVGGDQRGRSALVLLELGPDFGGQGHVNPGHLALEHLARFSARARDWRRNGSGRPRLRRAFSPPDA